MALKVGDQQTPSPFVYSNPIVGEMYKNSKYV